MVTTSNTLAWLCNHCTFLNAGSAGACEMCDARSPQAATPVISSGQNASPVVANANLEASGIYPAPLTQSVLAAVSSASLTKPDSESAVRLDSTSVLYRHCDFSVQTDAFAQCLEHVGRQVCFAELAKIVCNFYAGCVELLIAF